MKHEMFEKKVMDALLSGKDEMLIMLRKQYACAEIVSRDFTGVGFFTNFSVNNKELRLPKDNFVFGDVHGYIDKDAKVGFVLFIRNGFLSFLEGYTYGDDKWPSHYDDICICYNAGEHRDIESLKANWR